jgi:hypothetical protein
MKMTRDIRVILLGIVRIREIVFVGNPVPEFFFAFSNVKYGAFVIEKVINSHICLL